MGNKNNIQKFLYNVIGNLLAIMGGIIFYQGINESVINIVLNNPNIKIIVGFILLIISFYVFKKDINLLK